MKSNNLEAMLEDLGNLYGAATDILNENVSDNSEDPSEQEIADVMRGVFGSLEHAIAVIESELGKSKEPDHE